MRVGGKVLSGLEINLTEQEDSGTLDVTYFGHL